VNDELNELQALARIVDPLALCARVGRRLGYNPDNCDNTSRHARAFLAPYAAHAGADVEDVLELLRRLGAHCECEIGLNICSKIEGA
jgi:hypothetical protein